MSIDFNLAIPDQARNDGFLLGRYTQPDIYLRAHTLRANARKPQQSGALTRNDDSAYVYRIELCEIWFYVKSVLIFVKTFVVRFWQLKIFQNPPGICVLILFIIKTKPVGCAGIQ